MEYAELRKRELDFIDTLNLTQYIVPKANIYNMMQAIANDHTAKFCKKYQDAEELFTYCTNIDFIEFIEKKYHVQIVHEERWVIR